MKVKSIDIYFLVKEISQNYTIIIPKNIISLHNCINWNGNGLGDRWVRKIFNYSVIYADFKYKTYSENNEDCSILCSKISKFTNKFNKKGIIGIYIHSKRENMKFNYPIKKSINIFIKSLSCVVCGSDHKNDLYNDISVLDIRTQCINDFQPLCNHCNLQKKTSIII